MRLALSIFFIISLSIVSRAQVACNFSVVASDSTIVCGDSTTLTALGLAANPALSTNFNGSIGPGWASTQTPLFTNPCGPTLDGTPAAWFGAGVSPRTLTTVGFDVSCGAQVCFDLDFAGDENPTNCEDPDAANEGVYFQYSIDGGVTWVDIFYFQPNATMSGPYYSWNNYCFMIPAAAWTNNTMFQWTQIPTSGTNWDHWGIDNVVVTPLNCGFSYNWGGIGNPTADSTGVLTVGPTSTTSYVVNYTDGTTNCYDTITIVVEPWEIQASVNDSMLVCGDCANLNAVPVNYNGNNFNETFSWTPALGLNDAFIPNPVACPTDTTDYVITVLDPVTGCTASDTVTVYVEPPIITSITGGGIYCPGDVIGDITVTTNGNGPWTIDYTIDGTATSANGNAPFPVNLGNAVGTYVVTGVYNNGCYNPDFATDSIVLNAQPDVLAFYGGDEYCPYDTVAHVFADVIGTGPWIIDYTLNGVAQSITSNSNPVDFGTTPGVYVLTGISDAVCSNTATGTTTITIHPLPNVGAGADFISCDGDQITLNGTGASSYVWNNGVTNGVPFVPPTTTTYTVTGTDANGCINTDQITVTVELLPEVSYTSDIIEGCEPLTVKFFNTSTAQSDMVNCTWNFGDGQSGVSCDSIEHEFVSGGLYTI